MFTSFLSNEISANKAIEHCAAACLHDSHHSANVPLAMQSLISVSLMSAINPLRSVILLSVKTFLLRFSFYIRNSYNNLANNQTTPHRIQDANSLRNCRMLPMCGIYQLPNTTFLFPVLLLSSYYRILNLFANAAEVVRLVQTLAFLV